MESPNSNEEMMINNTEKKKFNPNDIKVNTIIDLNPVTNHKHKSDNHHLKNEKGIINLHLKSAFSVADVKYSEECKCGPSIYVDVSFPDHRKHLFKNTNNIDIKLFEYVIIEIESGKECATVVACGKEAEENLKLCYNNIIPEYSVVRKANSADMNRVVSNSQDEHRVIEKAKHLVERHKLDMKVTSAQWQFDRHRLTIFFTAPQRIDFRELVKDLAHEFKTRIELRQISTREEARRIGGMGPCGLNICCVSFSHNHCQITLDHARHQLLSSNVSKLSGYCGRLKCCLLYEHDVYVEILKKYPPLHSTIMTEEGTAYLNKIDVFKENATLYYPEKGLFKVITGEVLRKFTEDGKVKQPQNGNGKNYSDLNEEELKELESDY
jgi:cell fate regulator YaaT (PSP1 superfamily)